MLGESIKWGEWRDHGNSPERGGGGFCCWSKEQLTHEIYILIYQGKSKRLTYILSYHSPFVQQDILQKTTPTNLKEAPPHDPDIPNCSLLNIWLTVTYANDVIYTPEKKEVNKVSGVLIWHTRLTCSNERVAQNYTLALIHVSKVQPVRCILYISNITKYSFLQCTYLEFIKVKIIITFMPYSISTKRYLNFVFDFCSRFFFYALLSRTG